MDKPIFGLPDDVARILMMEAEAQARQENGGRPAQSAYVIAVFYVKALEYMRRAKT